LERIEEAVSRLPASYNIAAGAIAAPDGVTGDAAIRSMLGQLLVLLKKMDNPRSTVTVESPVLKYQVAEMMANVPNPELLAKWKALFEQTFTYDEPQKAGRNQITYRELIAAIIASELQFRNFTHW
jgi:hypothetical protein